LLLEGQIEQAEHVLVSYPCCYDTQQRRITAVDESGRQQYHHVQMMQLVFFTLEIVRAVWHMPRYRRAKWSRRELQALQIGLFEHFAN
jgi:hypothetical protein